MITIRWEKNSRVAVKRGLLEVSVEEGFILARILGRTCTGGGWSIPIVVLDKHIIRGKLYQQLRQLHSCSVYIIYYSFESCPCIPCLQVQDAAEVTDQRKPSVLA